jgi:hypothetical protein
MKTEYDFSKANRGQFYNAEAVFNFPVYLDPDVDEYMNKLASEKDGDIQQPVNEWLRANIKLVS